MKTTLIEKNQMNYYWLLIVSIYLTLLTVSAMIIKMFEFSKVMD